MDPVKLDEIAQKITGINDKSTSHENKDTDTGAISMNFCKVCTNTFQKGCNGCCSKDCYLKHLQFKLDECFKQDTSHTKFLAAHV